MKRILFIITALAVCYVTNVNASTTTTVSSSYSNVDLNQNITKHPDFTDAELRAVLKDIAFQLDMSFEDVLSLYERGKIALERPTTNTYRAIIQDADGGLNIELIGEIL